MSLAHRVDKFWFKSIVRHDYDWKQLEKIIDDKIIDNDYKYLFIDEIENEYSWLFETEVNNQMANVNFYVW